MRWFEEDRAAFDAGRRIDLMLTRAVDLAIALIEEGVELDHSLLTERWEVLMALAAAQAENTLRSAWSAAFSMYPIQGLALARLALEHVAILAYIPLHRDEAVGWFEKSRAPRKAGEMLAAVFGEVPLNAGERTLRSILDELSHQNPVVIAPLIESVRDGVLVFWVGSKPDQMQLRWSSGILMRITALTLEMLVRWKGGLDQRWANEVRELTGPIRAWIALNDLELRADIARRSEAPARGESRLGE